MTDGYTSYGMAGTSPAFSPAVGSGKSCTSMQENRAACVWMCLFLIQKP
jgi:hypothetical protein